MAAIRPMRIVSGSFKGRRIVAPSKLPVRPTTDFAKESLFNILNNHYHFSGLAVLDLFSGTGNIAYEFASRGAEKVICVDTHIECIKFINKTSKEFEMPIETIKSEVEKFLSTAVSSFDVIFADPPYDVSKEALEVLPKHVFERELLNKDGCLIIEHTKQISLSDAAHFSEERNYGNATFSFFFNNRLVAP